MLGFRLTVTQITTHYCRSERTLLSWCRMWGRHNTGVLSALPVPDHCACWTLVTEYGTMFVGTVLWRGQLSGMETDYLMKTEWFNNQRTTQSLTQNWLPTHMDNWLVGIGSSDIRHEIQTRYTNRTKLSNHRHSAFRNGVTDSPLVSGMSMMVFLWIRTSAL
jgi:hypothetical protein